MPSLSGSMPSASKTSGKRHLLRPPFDEQRRACEEKLGAIAVELGEHAERLRLRERLGLEERRPAVAPVKEKREVIDPIDAEKDRERA